jgi:hypothetical protein
MAQAIAARHARRRTAAESGAWMAWSFPHPPRGCCAPGCPEWGSCHCGCGSPTVPAAQNRGSTSSSGPLVRGRPRVWARGHAARLRVSGRGTRWSKHGVAGERVGSLVEFLIGVYGTQRAVGALLGISDSMVSLLRRRRVHRVNPAMARRIVDLVLASRRPPDPFATFEADGPRRLPTPAERQAMDRVADVRQLRAPRSPSAAETTRPG